MYKGKPITCVLITPAGSGRGTEAGRRWEESEDCIDGETGLLATHSQIPGRYYAYDYTGGAQLVGRLLPRTVTVTEAGRTVTTITVVSVEELGEADASLFTPTDEMRARGRPEGLGTAQKVARNLGSAAGGASTVCVFGVMTPDGQLMEAHSLQPEDPNSAAAVEAARQIKPARPPAGSPRQQHFLFVIVNFAVRE